VNLLPWLLNWPPSRRAVATFLLVTAFSTGTLLLFAPLTDQLQPENVTVETTDLTVRLNDEQALPESEDGGVKTCLASGTPGDSISVTGSVSVDIPSRERPRDGATVVVRMTDIGEATSGEVERTGGTFDVFWLLDDDETLAVGDTAGLQIRVRGGGETLATATRSVVVEAASRTYDC
jgi:hypothetical protein